MSFRAEMLGAGGCIIKGQASDIKYFSFFSPPYQAAPNLSFSLKDLGQLGGLCC